MAGKCEFSRPFYVLDPVSSVEYLFSRPFCIAKDGCYYSITGDKGELV